MTGLMTNRTNDRLTSMEDTYRKINHGHRRWDSFTKGHHKTTSTIGHRREITTETWTDGMDNTKTLFTSSSGTSNGRSRTKTKRILWSAEVTGIGTSPKRKVDPSRRSSRYSAVLQVTRTRPLLRNCKASIFCASRALSNCGATSDIPRFFWISDGKCSTTLLPKAISAKLKVKQLKTFHTTCLKSVR